MTKRTGIFDVDSIFNLNDTLNNTFKSINPNSITVKRALSV